MRRSARAAATARLARHVLQSSYDVGRERLDVRLVTGTERCVASLDRHAVLLGWSLCDELQRMTCPQRRRELHNRRARRGLLVEHADGGYTTAFEVELDPRPQCRTGQAMEQAAEPQLVCVRHLSRCRFGMGLWYMATTALTTPPLLTQRP